MEKQQILFDKMGIKISKFERNNYCINFEIENIHIILSKIINFKLLDIIYEVNKDIIEKYNINIDFEKKSIKNGEIIANVFMVFKHLFSDLGISQKYTSLNVIMKKNIEDSLISFHSYTGEKSDEIENLYSENNIQLLPIKNNTIYFKFENNHKVSVESNLYFQNDFEPPVFMEKMACNIIYKILLRTKQFIEMYR